jgi:hypothetical protein
MASSRIRGPEEAALILEEVNESLKREKERKQDGWGGWESKVSARSTPNPSHGTKMLGKNASHKES